MERMREMSLDDFDVLGLKSHNLAILSHSVPGSILAVSATSSFSAVLFACLVLATCSSCCLYQSSSSFLALTLNSSLANSSAASFSLSNFSCSSLQILIFSGSSLTGGGTGIDTP